jgi:glycosyltransferase involved in cell wall biosynthesis
VVVEAWAQSVPVISTDTFGPGTMIEHMKTGVLTPVDDPMTLANAIRFLLDDGELRSRLAEGGRAAYEERFTEDAVVERYIQFFRDVTG